MSIPILRKEYSMDVLAVFARILLIALLYLAIGIQAARPICCWLTWPSKPSRKLIVFGVLAWWAVLPSMLVIMAIDMMEVFIIKFGEWEQPIRKELQNGKARRDQARLDSTRVNRREAGLG